MKSKTIALFLSLGIVTTVSAYGVPASASRVDGQDFQNLGTLQSSSTLGSTIETSPSRPGVIFASGNEGGEGRERRDRRDRRDRS
jgi:hypothetical protein